MSETKKQEVDEQLNQTGQSSHKKSIRFVEEQGVSDEQFSSGNFQRSVNTSRAVSDSTHEDDEDIEDMAQDNSSRFKQIKSIDILLPSGEEKIIDIVSSSPSKRTEKSCTASSVHSENQDDNLSVHFGGLEILDENDLPKFEYEPDDIPRKSILKNDNNRSRNISFDVRMLKDIEGKVISHDNLFINNPDAENDEGEGSKNNILKDSQLNDDTNSQGRSQGSGIINKSMESSNDDDDEGEDEFEDENQGDHKIEYRNRLDSEVRFKLQPIIQEASDNPIDTGTAKRNSLLFPAYSILKNSPLVQPSEFKTLKQIEKVSHYSQHTSNDNSMNKNVQSNSQHESDNDSQDSQEKEETDVRFVGDIVLQEENAYKFKYNPEENPKKPIIKRGSCMAHYAMTPNARTTSQFSSFIAINNIKQEISNKKRMSYDFLNLKNVDGKVIKHWQQKYIEDNNVNDEQNRDIKFGGIEILDTVKLGDQTQASKTVKPQKPILKTYRGRSSSLDFKKSIKNIDGVYIRRDKKQEEDEDEKVVHFGEVIQTEENQNNENKSINININLVQHHNSEQQDQRQSGEESSKKSILKRSSSVQMRQTPFISSNENTPTARKKSTFSNRKIEIKENFGFEIPTQDAFTANWTSIRNDYLESAFQFLIVIKDKVLYTIKIDTKNLHNIFSHGMQSQMFNQIIEVLHSRSENSDTFVKSYIESLYKIKNFQSLLFINKHQQDNIQELLDSLELNHAIDQSTYNQLCSIYILKQTD